ncbi:hypothetical protein GOP47_0000516 [Adiantum capillus-veneris]|uniref:Alpha-type protein kinase domain-containing protein n=1 Tax=Adiantum capillus-veneris TaxID=13818 RepID=A0A9D4VDP8_ADICA|nr:hypothetical protein GOP47_0000516 [Adiantum capillus-veneris]
MDIHSQKRRRVDACPAPLPSSSFTFTTPHTASLKERPPIEAGDNIRTTPEQRLLVEDAKPIIKPGATTTDQVGRLARASSSLACKTKLEREKVIINIEDEDAASLVSSTSTRNKAWAKPDSFARVQKVIKQEPGSTPTLPRPETSSKTRLEMEALRKELAQLKANARASRMHEINQMLRAAQALDLAFLFDATDSMRSYLEVVKTRILKIVRSISDAYPDSYIRVAFAFYRDYNSKKSSGSCNFTTSFKGSRSTFVEALSCVGTKSGDDTAEDVFSGLQAIAQLDWTAHNRVVYHIADAPCHGTRFHDMKGGDDYPNGDLHGRDIAVLLHDLREDCKISTYTFLHIGPTTHKMLKEFKRVAQPDNSWIHEDDFNGMFIEDIPTKVAMACKSSISESLSTISSSRMNHSNVKFVPRDVQAAMPHWGSIRAQEGEVYKFRRYGNLDEVLCRIENGIPLELERAECVQVKVGHHPFSNDGASRWPFYAQIVTHEYETKTMVVKRFKDRLGADTSRVHAKEKYIEQMEVQAVSSQFAEEFDCCIRNIQEAKKVAFTIVSALRAQSNMYYNMEKVLTGLWTKFNSNAGYVNGKKAYTDTLQAFSHWTHERSKGKVMVTDLQGVQISSVGTRAFLLCDPAIHSKDVLRFTRTNLGEKGFELFYNSHKCNTICRRLGLKATPLV